MRAMVVFESMYGNTWEIAEAIAEGLSPSLPVEVVEVGNAPQQLGDDVQLLVVGAPTHALGLSRENTRADAAEQAGRAVISAGLGVREWLEVLRFPRGLAVATFDTHIDKRWVPGSAAAVARRRLRRLGGVASKPPESFYVSGTEGPLLPGERDRARAWGQGLLQAVDVSQG